ncbi:MAG: Nif3-like dinuclear metal center hexameric protein [Clostridiales bacterium]|nr:Nif3-like dinuclear metal center hexameric protein [Clostridiales bacterium]
MSCRISDIIEVLEELFPLYNAMEYDNPGLLCGDRNGSADNILLTLDCTSDAVMEAKKLNCSLIIAHHPLIFGGIDSISLDKPTGRILTELVRNDIALYACHTQLDCTDEFGNRAIASALGLESRKLEGATIGVIAETDSDINMFSRKVTENLRSSGVITLSPPEKHVGKIFIQGGSFDEENIDAIVSSGADTVLTGEMKHHHMVLLSEYGIGTLLCGHNASERIYLPELKNVLDKKDMGVQIFVDNGKETTLNYKG